MERLPIHELKSNLQNAIKPECKLDSSIDSLLKDALKEFSWDHYVYQLFGLWYYGGHFRFVYWIEI